MGVPQILLIVLVTLSLGVTAAKHGETKCEETHNFFLSLVADLIVILILYWGGFFTQC